MSVTSAPASAQVAVAGCPVGAMLSDRWPHIHRFLHVKAAGWVDGDLAGFVRVEDMLSPADQAAAYEEWADFYEWRLVQRADEFAADPGAGHLERKWVDSMAYCCRRLAAQARGEDPGPWVQQWERRPDLEEEGRAIIAKVIAKVRKGNDKPLS